MVLSPESADPLVMTKLPRFFTDVTQLGKGSHGTVMQALTILTKQPVALKIVRRTYASVNAAVHSLREVKYLTKLNHPNVMRFRGIYGLKGEPYTTIIMVMDQMTCSLHTCIKEHETYFNFPLEKENCMLQILSGLAYLHSADIVHRDLKPGNILCLAEPRKYKITDFDHARKIDAMANDYMTYYVGTSTYRAPEMIISPEKQRASMDIYSAGLIFLGVLLARPNVLPGKPGMAHLKSIFAHTGTPDDDDLRDVATEEEKQYYISLGAGKAKKTWFEKFPQIGETAGDLAEAMLQFSPSNRATAAQALMHNYLSPIRLPGYGVQNYEGEALSDYAEDYDIMTALNEVSESITTNLNQPDELLVPTE